MVDEEIVDYLQANGIIVSAGHTNATYKQAMKGFEKIDIVTHLFNAMSQFQSVSREWLALFMIILL